MYRTDSTMVQGESLSVYCLGIDGSKGAPHLSECVVTKTFSIKHATSGLQVV